MKPRQPSYKLIQAKSVFTITLIVIPLTILSVYLWGLGQHRTFFENSILSTTILSAAFFLFITAGLYHGVKVKDDIGYFEPGKRHISPSLNLPADLSLPDVDIDAGEGCAGILIGIVLWILFAIAIVSVLLFLETVVPAVIVAFAAMLYWIFFRALRLVFKNSNKSKGSLMKSMRHGLTYTLLYNCWIYAIILFIEYVKK